MFNVKDNINDITKNSNTLTINTTCLSYDESYNMGWQNRSTNYQFPIDTTKTDKHLNIKEKQQTIKKDKNKEKLKYGKKSDWKRELLQIIKILQDNSVDVTSIPTTKRRVYTILKDIRQEGVDIESIIKDNQLDENYKIGQKLNYFRLVYKGTIKRQMSDEEKMMAEELGIVEKKPTGRQKALFKGGKISQFHIDFINEHLSDIFSGKLNTKETLKLLRQASISENETIIEDAESIKRIVEILLKDRPEELKKYNRTVKKNIMQNLEILKD